jgi:acyl-CoA synthetase (AMP-forming)/AMP-acid ligase II
VVGIPDPVFGEEICAVVQLKPKAQATEEELRAHTAGYVTKFKIPARVVFEAALPRNSTGKVLKRELRQRLAAGVPDASR